MLSASTKSLAVELLVELLKAYTPSGEEARALGVLQRYAEELGYEEVYVDEVGNFVAERGEGARVALVGHVDTVAGFLEVREEGGEVWGRGAVDAKGPLAAMMVGGSLAEGVRVVFVASVGEEADSRGAKALLGRLRAEHIIVGEPTNLDGIAIGCRGSCRLSLECRSPGGHAATPQADSACRTLLEVLGELSSHDGYTFAPVFLCCEKSGDNVLPKRARAEVNVRIPVGKSSEQLKELLKDLRCGWELSDCSEPFQTSPSNPVARSLARALSSMQLKPRYTVKLGTSDMNILGKITKNIAEYGPGRAELSHSEEERISLEEYFLGIEAYSRALTELGKLSVKHRE
ncbi:MAG: M20/M25/M40 family metallo-hydrolase [Acidilobaceae archaeon]|nr:M20/M25/M40 family metallo-hydrolase [Acidilobaceae archaeon]MCX8165937.1 M20/M25/M40 family metallo-hydrolase [Acidilobaceae archaeon]MDW7974580.1 M20/M25/M40 family metallo-hydrolase [Sulfolobales archaeon]